MCVSPWITTPGGGIDHCDTVQHEPVQRSRAQHGLGPRQLHPVVDADALVVVLEPQHLDASALAEQDLDDRGEIELALGVVTAHLGEALPEQIPVHEVDAGVALLDAELLGACVRGLHDAREPALGVAHQDARHVDHSREHRQLGSRVALVLLQTPEARGREEGRVAVENQHVAGEILQLRFGLAHRVAGSE